ncbi:MAG: hypothetical protein ACJAXI_000204, partial [Crocinitomicaceae bacterium]
SLLSLNDSLYPFVELEGHKPEAQIDPSGGGNN